jgi:hypothetical protein
VGRALPLTCSIIRDLMDRDDEGAWVARGDAEAAFQALEEVTGVLGYPTVDSLAAAAVADDRSVVATV